MSSHHEHIREIGGAAPTIPRANGHPLLGLLPRLSVDPLATLLEAAKLGDVVDLGARHKRIYELTTPALVKDVLQRWREFPRGRFTLKPLLGEGLVTTDGPGWQERRRLLQPVFSMDRLDALVPGMSEAIDAMLDRWAARGADATFDVAQEMNTLSLRIALRGLFGTELSAHDQEVIGVAVSEGLAYLNSQLFVAFRIPLWVPLPSKIRFRRARRALHDVVHRIIQRRRSTPRDEEDLLAMMLAARDGERGGTDDELRDEAVTMLIAGHDTIASGLAWTWYLLAQHPAVQDETRAESAKLVSAEKISYARVRELRWASAAASEALRMYPPIWFMTRVAKEDSILGGYAIPKGTALVVSPYVIHRQAKVWDEPDTFRPERFLDKKPSDVPKGSYLPFGWGPHICIGAAFAMIQAQLVIAKVNSRFRLELANPNDVPVPKPLITMHPAGPIRVRARPW